MTVHLIACTQAQQATRGLQAFSQEIAVERIVGIGEEGALPAIAALGDMVRQAGDDDTGKAGHGPQVTPAAVGASIKCTVTEIPKPAPPPVAVLRSSLPPIFYPFH